MIYEDPDDKLPDGVDFGIDEDEVPEPSAPEVPEVAEPPAEPTLEAKPESKPEKGEPPAAVPYNRFKGVIDERNDAREALAKKDLEIAELKAKAEKPEPAKPDATLSEKIRAQNAALLQGDEEAAERIGLELEELRQELAINAALARIEARNQAAALKVQESEADAAARELVNTYPALNNASDAFDPDLHAEVCALADGYAKSMSVAEALKKAAARLIGGAAPSQPAKPAKSKAFENAQIAARIPPSLSSAGTSNANAAVTQFSTQAVRKMTDEQIKKMTPEEKDIWLGNA